MVRLKGSNRIYVSESESLFQFHYGTIKRYLRHNRVWGIGYFNSTMVRLKACGRGNIMYNPQNFNSTMVRLKASYIIHAGTAYIFQFHYGTIKSTG